MIISKVGPDQMTVGGLLDELKKAPTDWQVMFDFCNFAPAGWGSYRGYYEDLALEPEKGKYQTVKNLVGMLNEALNGKMEGYKGGTYRVEPETPVWVSEYGDCDNTYVCGVDLAYVREVVVLKTAYDI